MYLCQSGKVSITTFPKKGALIKEKRNAKFNCGMSLEMKFFIGRLKHAEKYVQTILLNKSMTFLCMLSIL